MARSATTTETTLPTRPVEESGVKLTADIGTYKGIAPIGYEKKAEEEGIDGFSPATVRFNNLFLILRCNH